MPNIVRFLPAKNNDRAASFPSTQRPQKLLADISFISNLFPFTSQCWQKTCSTPLTDLKLLSSARSLHVCTQLPIYASKLTRAFVNCPAALHLEPMFTRGLASNLQILPARVGGVQAAFDAVFAGSLSAGPGQHRASSPQTAAIPSLRANPASHLAAHERRDSPTIHPLRQEEHPPTDRGSRVREVRRRRGEPAAGNSAESRQICSHAKTEGKLFIRSDLESLKIYGTDRMS